MTLTKFSRLLDNRERGNVGQFPRDNLRSGANCSVVSAYFTSYARAAFEQKMKKYCEKARVPLPFNSEVATISGDRFYQAIKAVDASKTVLPDALRTRMEPCERPF